MDNEDYRALIELVTEELHRSGLSDIAHERHYTYSDMESGEARLHAPHKRLVLMLEAFARHVATQDRALVEQSLRTISEVVHGDGPQRAVVELASDGRAREIDLAEAPDMSVVRQDLQILIGRLRTIDFREH